MTQAPSGGSMTSEVSKALHRGAVAQEPDGARLGIVQGDRPCTGCGFNLYGQAIVRERHYQMLICRCPECGVVAALQEYPLLGRWAGRWSAVLAGLWFLVLLGGVGITAGVILGISNDVRAKCVEPFARFLAEEHKVYQQEQAKKGTPGSQAGWLANQTGSPFDQIDLTWWRLQEVEALVARARSADRTITYRGLYQLKWALVSMPLAGFAWAAALPGVRRRRMWLPALMILAIAMAFRMLADHDLDSLWGGYYYASMIADSTLGASLNWVVIGACYPPLVAGMMLGRPVVRWLVVVLLPPRLRIGLSVLWSCDGLPMPRVG